MAQTSHLIFDCDGVIVDSEILASQVTVEGLRPLGYTLDALAHAHRFAGMQEPAILQRIRQEDGIDIPEGFEHDLVKAFRSSFAAKLQVIPGMPDLIKQVQVPKTVVSNSRLQDLERSLTKAKVKEFFGRRVFSSEQVAHPKPAPDVYLLAIQQIGLPKDRLLVIEDSVSGVQAALAAGLEVIGFLGASHIASDHGSTLQQLGVRTLAADAKALTQLLTERELM